MSENSLENAIKLSLGIVDGPESFSISALTRLNRRKNTTLRALARARTDKNQNSGIKSLGEIENEEEKIIKLMNAYWNVHNERQRKIDDIVVESRDFLAIDEWVGGTAALHRYDTGDERVNTPVREKLTDAEIKEGFENQGLALHGFERMRSSAYNNDCLIHSLLTALSPRFRSLHTKYKDIIANHFRINVLTRIFQTIIDFNQSRDPPQAVPELIRDLADLKRKNSSLEISVAFVFSEHYRINILYKDRPEYGWLIQINSDAYPIILLYNPGRGHYESIRNPEGNIYMFDSSIFSNYRPKIGGMKKRKRTRRRRQHKH